MLIFWNERSYEVPDKGSKAISDDGKCEVLTHVNIEALNRVPLHLTFTH